MPKIISRQPAWLSRSSPAYRLFNGVRAPQFYGEHQSSEGKLEAPGLRTLAHRGSEVFIANGNTVRWADLASMKVDWEEKQNEHHVIPDDDSLISAQYRILEFKYVAEPIIQLSISPNNSLLAVVTAHTIHVCVIPDSKALSEPDNGPIHPKTYMVGNTTHVLSSARIISVLWHPFGIGGNCLVTVTSDAVVRLWEFSTRNRYSGEKPTLAIDLRKLRNAKSTEDDVQPRPLGISEGISFDSLGMEVASACFGGTGAAEELGWAGMTLWVAMTEGDVYALCPLLPPKWQALPAVLPNLAATILAEKGDQETGSEKSDFLAQYQWISEQESVPAMEAPRESEFQQRSLIYTRPTSISAVPRLQGPFSILPGDLEFELALADIHVVAPRLQAKDQNAEDFCDIQGVHGQWLPEKASANSKSDEGAEPELIVLGAVDTFKRSDMNTTSLAGWPTLTPDTMSPYAFYVTHSKGIWYTSAEQWAEGLESEMSTATTAGTGFRIGVGAEGSKIHRQKVISLLEREEDQPSTPLIINDSDLGHLILTVYEATPQVAILDSPHINHIEISSTEPQIKQEPTDPDFEASIQLPPRAAYIPSKVFRQDLAPLKDRLRKPPGLNTRLNQITMSEQVRLSPAILELMTHDHRVLSEETHKLGLAIADLFTRCNMMQAEFKSQIKRVREIAERVDNINGNDGDDGENEEHRNGPAGKFDKRLSAATAQQTALVRRFEKLRKRTAAIGRPLSDRERSYIGEVDRLARDLPETIDQDDQSADVDSDKRASIRTSKSQDSGKFLRRYDEVQQLAEELCSQVGSIIKQGRLSTEENDGSRPTSPSNGIRSSSRGLRVPPDIRKQKMALLENSMERQTALLEATMERLERLGIEL